jgi:colanic acid/amylovoran biosynthesis glycosyltransferase
MKILFCTNTFENVQNGPTKFANYLLEINKLYKHAEIRILTEDISADSIKLYAHAVIRLDLKLNYWTKSWGFIYRMFPYYQACQNIKSEFNFDIVVFNNAITGIWSALKLKKPVLGMINDDNSARISLKNFDGSRRWFRHLIFRYLEQAACVFEAGIIVNSQFLQTFISNEYKTDSAKLHLLHKGLVVSKKCTVRLSVIQSPVKVLFVKSDYIRGGLGDLITALGLLKNYKFILQVAGPKKIYERDILQRNKSSCVSIDFIGPVSQSTVQNLMKHTDLFIVPSRQEAFGVANAEALMHGLTVITTNAGGIPEVMDQGNNGWMVNPGDPLILAKTIQQVIENPEERLLKQKSGYHFVCQHFSHEKVLGRFMEILKEHQP